MHYRYKPAFFEGMVSPKPDDLPFTVIVRGQVFSMSRMQILAQPFSFFEKAFFGGFVEAETRILRLDRHPATFPVILDYLSGYEVFPLAEEEWKGTGLDKAKFLRYLKADSEYYALDALATLVREEIGMQRRAEEKKPQESAAEAALQRKHDLNNCLFEGKIAYDEYVKFMAFDLLLPDMQKLCRASGNMAPAKKGGMVNVDMIREAVTKQTGLAPGLFKTAALLDVMA